jgi:hypothetical protein
VAWAIGDCPLAKPFLHFIENISRTIFRAAGAASARRRPRSATANV